MNDGIMITLDQMLQARENRAAMQRSIIGIFSLPLISFTVNIPGPRKSTAMSRRIFQEGYRILMQRLTDNNTIPVYRMLASENPAGPEAFIAVEADLRELKQIVVQLEHEHPLGRLFDFDVLGRDGKAVSRSDLGYPKRKCFVCGKEAHACGRSRAHSVDELLEAIHSAADAYFESKTIGGKKSSLAQY